MAKSEFTSNLKILPLFTIILFEKTSSLYIASSNMDTSFLENIFSDMSAEVINIYCPQPYKFGMD